MTPNKPPSLTPEPLKADLLLTPTDWEHESVCDCGWKQVATAFRAEIDTLRGQRDELKNARLQQEARHTAELEALEHDRDAAFGIVQRILGIEEAGDDPTDLVALLTDMGRRYQQATNLWRESLTLRRAEKAEADLLALQASYSALQKERDALKASLNPFRGELSIYRNDQFLMGVCDPFVEPVLEAIRSALPGEFSSDLDRT